MKKLKLKKSFQIENPTENYYEFISRFNVKINMSFPTTFSLEKNSVLQTQDLSTHLFQKVKTTCNIYNNDCFRLVFHPCNNGINIHIIEVSSHYQGQGLGRKLMNMILKISNNLNIPIFLIPVSIGNVSIDKLRKFYHSFGFKRDGKSRYWKYSPVRVIPLQPMIENYENVA